MMLPTKLFFSRVVRNVSAGGVVFLDKKITSHHKFNILFDNFRSSSLDAVSSSFSTEFESFFETEEY